MKEGDVFQAKVDLVLDRVDGTAAAVDISGYVRIPIKIVSVE